ncbi:hypothetical protein UFOVP588_50 [uncultured Caudovirales phage]|uniref:Uncharacterized protein n=1 Tax=uncultured Caudovirales phage TaxID=2100421 RepID=A0A6J5N0G5_9CAUD|nr:hypothetical protein UFOVP588_50 [uncultured Caudovirales phage]
MALTTYAELKTSVGDWLNRTDLATAISDFVSLAEAQIERQLRTRQMIVRATASIGTEYSAVPADFLETKSLKLNTNPVTALQFETVDSLDSLSNTTYLSSGKPLYFSIVGGQIRVLPIPDGEYTAELVYYAKLAKLSNTNTTNWLLTQAPDVYLYGSLLQAAPYLQDDARIPVWSSLYQAGLDQLQIADDRGSTSGGALMARARTFG